MRSPSSDTKLFCLLAYILRTASSRSRATATARHIGSIDQWHVCLGEAGGRKIEAPAPDD